jgi:hypothetical protein
MINDTLNINDKYVSSTIYCKNNDCGVFHINETNKPVSIDIKKINVERTAIKKENNSFNKSKIMRLNK